MIFKAGLIVTTRFMTSTVLERTTADSEYSYTSQTAAESRIYILNANEYGICPHFPCLLLPLRLGIWFDFQVRFFRGNLVLELYLPRNQIQACRQIS